MNLKILSKLFFFVFCGLCFLSVSISAQETKRTIQRSSSVIRNSYAYKFTDRDFVNTPSWNQDEGEPPLSVSSAMKIARENLPRFVKSADSWKTSRIMMQSLSEDKWYYRILFLCSRTACKEIEDRSFEVIVKMDGMIIEPKKVTIED